jgi:hypothetical protein
MIYDIGMMEGKDYNNFLIKRKVIERIYKKIFGPATCLETTLVNNKLDIIFEEMIERC